MKTGARILFVFLALVIATPSALAGENPIVEYANAQKEFRRAIFRNEVKIHAGVLVRDELWKNGTGTGVIVGRENQPDKTVFYIITAAHVMLTENSELLKETKIVVAFPEKSIAFPAAQSGYSAKFLFGAWNLEYVMLEVEVPNADLEKLDINVASVAQKAPERLESFWVSGYLQGRYPVINEAYLSQVNINERGQAGGFVYFLLMNFYFIANGVGGPGMSGGGVFNARGELVAMIWAMNGDNIVNAIPAFLIQQDFLARLEALKSKPKEGEKK